MRVFALSDVHVDYEPNAKWISGISQQDYRSDVLLLAGDVSGRIDRLEWCVATLAARFRQVMFVPGNHDLWARQDRPLRSSMEKLNEIMKLVASHGGLTGHFRAAGLLIIPIFGWYDYSFGEPSEELKTIWMDYHACRWPPGYEAKDIAERMFAFNGAPIAAHAHEKVITFSHFLPRKDLLSGSHWQHRLLYPVLGSHSIEQRLRRLGAEIHVYGHSHVNRNIRLDGVQYINGAIGYPQEAQFTAKRLLCIHGET